MSFLTAVATNKVGIVAHSIMVPEVFLRRGAFIGAGVLGNLYSSRDDGFRIFNDGGGDGGWSRGGREWGGSESVDAGERAEWSSPRKDKSGEGIGYVLATGGGIGIGEEFSNLGDGTSEGGSPELIWSTSEGVGGGYLPNFSKEELADDSKGVGGVARISMEMGNIRDSGFCRTEDIDERESELIFSVSKPRVDGKGKGGTGEGGLVTGSATDGIETGGEGG
ncbi:hypothetical protein M405DRAFT_895698 [Rhizopogon salebrosus TDB-379]|nr:hypothetical protein M405DRAFT_895698 [Rhizopogon salebrosus TDB-379]